MNYEMLAAFSIGMIILAATPGPGVFGSMSKAVAEGYKASLYFIGGLALGDVMFFILALIGMSTISIVMGEMFFIIKIAGGLYLIYLGVKMFRTKNLSAAEIKAENKSGFKTFLGGLLLTLGNPKPILFYASVVPTIININEVRLIDASLMILTITSVLFIVLGTYCYFASLSRKLLGNKSVQSKVNKTAGAIMCATGTYIVIE
ncbi:MAG: LysE family translocator [Ignavibacteriaceae bacterium]